ncbi:MAG: uncharacterized protein KVP18_004551 [Porospora cf. gigantea A]|uniref:uncharacterized protein n=1 Tax=Porospora cf. gigantea A TaxID=2853593 RepID=UPI00355A9388|nr:MAG: hypothetical protein KVP18_004551 [Porospora cf. gigantea A]
MSGVDWAGLLKWSLQHTDGTVDGHIAEEDRHFLQEAIKHAMSQVRDPHEAVIEALEQLKSEDVTVQLAGLSIVNKCLDEAPEVSRNLAKLGAVAPLFTCLQSSDPHVVELVLDLCFAFALPNNTALQTIVHEQKGLTKFCLCLQASSSAVDKKRDGLTPEEISKWSNVQVKCFGCLAALIRNHPESTAAFAQRNGLVWITYGLKSKNWRLQQKVFTLAAYLCPRVPIPRETLTRWTAELSVMLRTDLYLTIGPQHGELMALFLQALAPSLMKESLPVLPQVATLVGERATRLDQLTSESQE